MIELYFWTTPNGYKPLLFLEEAGIDYEIRPVNISKGEQFAPEILKLSPNNRIPAIVDHDPEGGGAPLAQFESGAILQYLAEKTGKFISEDARGRAEVLQWLNWQMGGIGPMFGQYLHFVDYAPEDLPYAKDRYTREAERLLGVLDKRLEARAYVAGEHSIADLAIYPWVRRILARFEGFENVRRWASTVAQRPATIRAYEKGAAINTVPTINKESRALLLGLTGGNAGNTGDRKATKSPRSVTEISASLNFIRRQDSKPEFQSSALTGGAPKYFYDTEARTVTISDMREIAEDLSVDREGFELLHHETAVEDLYDDDAVEQAYFPEIEALLRHKFGASQVVIFDVTRRSDGGAGAKKPEGWRGAASQLHVDYTAKSGPQRVKDILGEEEAARLTAAGARIIQINVWRPIRGPVERSPLALADASSTRQEDLIATDQIFPDRVGEIYNVAHAPSQRWYYAPRMTANEVLLIKGWDSLDDGRARFTPHGAFHTPETRENAHARESIEVRTLVVIEKHREPGRETEFGPSA